MRVETTKKLISLYLKVARYFGRRLRLPKKYRGYFDMSMHDFSDLINEYDYKQDPLSGLFDYISSPDKFFNPDKKFGRDCDDWSRLWSLWGLYNGYKAYEYVVCDPSSIKKTFATLHCVTVLEKEGKYYLMNYHPYGPAASKEEALKVLEKVEIYSKNLLIVLDREITLA